MDTSSLEIIYTGNILSLVFEGELTLYNIAKLQKKIETLHLNQEKKVVLDFSKVTFFDTASALMIYALQERIFQNAIELQILSASKDISDMIELVKKHKDKIKATQEFKQKSYLEILGRLFYEKYLIFLSFMAFLGEFFTSAIHNIGIVKNIRYKEIFFEINENGIKAIGIISVTSFLIGLVVAYQSAYQLKLYGANIFIVETLGLSILRELAPLITAIVIAGRSGSAFTAQIGAMKITQEIDAMMTMGFEPFRFLVIPRVVALMIIMPILIFIADIMGILGGMLIAYKDLNISTTLFIDRFNDVIEAKHFFIGIIKGPFFAFLIAVIGIYRGIGVKDDTQSIGINTKKSVVESIFAVIMCDALFSIIFTNLGI
ncbi:MlaE family lipid ABC transporter permease subunit [Sulfurimonas sp.]|jgi:phospholipid/cholesterol/gamma-HCH transport system permease protein|uniref:ABC transporter permease n=1 Tax=Sulfurimonas sp. TaxID=2022749 RepID=UPI0025E4F695|nr:MlaE family lipid ABC transporter permease subunit [Sulfurimonas sp.]MCK9473869.1 MlaE family lipid ABC transporter permease subunit [Sulfurimonas sp.]MDD3505312.1 MlaE family lipid ABC transporter permease subunit [Sulfurimonas sp.]